jgi:hypothetical protein
MEGSKNGYKETVTQSFFTLCRCAPISVDSVSMVSVIHGSLQPEKNWKIKEINSL